MRTRMGFLVSMGLAVSIGLAPAAARAAEGPQVLFVLDGSGSMWGQVDGTAKIEVARSVMADLLASLPEEVSVGLASYGHNRKGDCDDIEVLAPVGSARDAIVQAVNALNPKGKTPLTASIKMAAEQFREVEGAASVVVVSDGKETCGGDPCAAAREARASGVDMRVHAVGFDVTAEEAAQLNCIAEEGGGQYYGASNTVELAAAFEQVEEIVVAQAEPPPPPPPPAPPAAEGLPFEDAFERDELGGDYEVLKPDENRLALVDGKALVITAVRPSGNSGTNTVILKRDLPGNFEATIRMDNQIVRDHEAGLYYYVDEDNYLFVAAWGRCCVSRKPYFGKMQGGQWSRTDAPFNDLGSRKLNAYSPASEPWFLRISRSGVKYTASVSEDGTKWMQVGETAFLNKKGRIGFGSFLANDHNMGESPAEFDDLKVVPK